MQGEGLEFCPIHRSLEDGMRRYGLSGGTVAFFIFWVLFCLGKFPSPYGLLIGLSTSAMGLAVIAGKPPYWLTFTALFGLRYLQGRRSLAAAAPAYRKAQAVLSDGHRAYARAKQKRGVARP